MLASAYALPMANSGVVAIICVWVSQQWPGITFAGQREVGRTAQDSRLEKALRNSRWGRGAMRDE